MSYASYLAAERIINEGLIREGLSLLREGQPPRDPRARMEEMRSFLAACGDPQAGVPAIHVGGTSGKGSVSAAIAGGLAAAGFRVGLHVSPYLQSATEKIWIDGRFVSAEHFAELVEWVRPVAEPRVHPDTPASIHGMASVAIALEAFRRAAVDVMVFEVGCGGRFDLTSFLETEVALVTNVGWDHVVSLGPTLEDIAWHKAGIARPGVPLITGARGSALEIIREEAEKCGAPLEIVPQGGDAHGHNLALASAAVRAFSTRRGRSLDEHAIRRGLESVHLAGRSELMPKDGGPSVILDGAHNAEKIAVAVERAEVLAPGAPRVALVGFLGAKANEELVRPLRGRFDRAVVTEPQVFGKKPLPAEEAGRLVEAVGLPTEVVPEGEAALARARALAGPGGAVLATGSFYLVGALRDLWYPKEQVVTERSSWPSV